MIKLFLFVAHETSTDLGYTRWGQAEFNSKCGKSAHVRFVSEAGTDLRAAWWLWCVLDGINPTTIIILIY